MTLNELCYRVESLGPAVSILAWMSVFLAAVIMARVLKKSLPQKIWIPALIVGGISLTAHLFDYIVTLYMSPTLAEEANPIWRIVINNYGLNIAKVYGLTGKVLLSILSFEFFAYYLIKRENLFPKNTNNLFSFWKEFGIRNGEKSVLHLNNIVNLFSFLFALIGPFYFYVALMNSMVKSSLYFSFPSILTILPLYLAVEMIAYFIITYRAFRYGRK